MHSEFAYALDFYRNDGTAIGQTAITPDWMPALEWVHFEGVRTGQLPPLMAASIADDLCRVDPVWHAQYGRPAVSAFRITLPANGSGAVSRDIPTSYLRDLVRQLSAAMVEKGELRSGEVFRYTVSAFAATRAASAAQPSAVSFGVEEIAQPLPLADMSLETFVCGARQSGVETSGDVPVFVPQAVLDEAMELARQAGDVETGGVLVGQLHRDASVPDIFVEITAQIPALHTEAESTKLTFTPDTWSAVRAALALRQRGEVMVGWWHFHPDFCRLRNCPLENRLQCTASSAFFSSDDVALHTALFARAYNIALLISDGAATGLTPSLFGWRQGMVMARGFYTIGGETDAASSAD